MIWSALKERNDGSVALSTPKKHVRPSTKYVHAADSRTEGKYLEETQDRVDTFYECCDNDITNHFPRPSSSPSRKLKLDVSAVNVSHNPEVRFAAVYKRASNDKQARGTQT